MKKPLIVAHIKVGGRSKNKGGGAGAGAVGSGGAVQGGDAAGDVTEIVDQGHVSAAGLQFE